MAFEVDEDGAVVPPLAERPVVDAEHCWRGQHPVGSAADQAQQSIGTDRHPEPAGQTCARFAAECEGDGRQPLPLALGPVGRSRGDPGEALAEDLLWAGGVGAEELADGDPQAHRQRRPGEVGQGAHVAAADTVRPAPPTRPGPSARRPPAGASRREAMAGWGGRPRGPWSTSSGAVVQIEGILPEVSSGRGPVHQKRGRTQAVDADG
jgi:hypothetical protein